jgi:hypothetical protein
MVMSDRRLSLRLGGVRGRRGLGLSGRRGGRNWAADCGQRLDGEWTSFRKHHEANETSTPISAAKTGRTRYLLLRIVAPGLAGAVAAASLTGGALVSYPPASLPRATRSARLRCSTVPDRAALGDVPAQQTFY